MSRLRANPNQREAEVVGSCNTSRVFRVTVCIRVQHSLLKPGGGHTAGCGRRAQLSVTWRQGRQMLEHAPRGDTQTALCSPQRAKHSSEIVTESLKCLLKPRSRSHVLMKFWSPRTPGGTEDEESPSPGGSGGTAVLGPSPRSLSRAAPHAH